MIDILADSISIDQPTTSAARAASQNWAANLKALSQTQPTIPAEIETLAADVEWVYGRDGSLTAMQDGQRWWAGCSLPKQAAEFMLAKAELPSTVACFLYPLHAGQLRVTLDRMESGQAVIALIPQSHALRIILSCDDFSADIRAHRLYFAAGENWEAELDRLLEHFPGLPTPTQFIRPILSDSSPADVLVEPAQKIFVSHSTRRSARVKEIREGWRSTDIRRICLVAPSHFRLWDDTGAALAAMIPETAEPSHKDSANCTFLRFDSNNPASASPLALAEAAAQCDAIVTPNTGRADLPGIVPDDMPWATWITSPRIPSADAAGKRDTLLVADPQWKKSAIERGWAAERIFIAGWPDAPLETVDMTPPGVFRMPSAPIVSIICNTRPLDPPASIIEYSSHRLLWDAIREELLENPFALKKSVDDFLSDRMRQARLDDEGFDRHPFVDGIILHAWQQGIAKFLLREKVPLKLFGTSWSDLDSFETHAAGPLKSRHQLARAIRSSAALIHVWPTATAHPIEATGKPVIRAHQRRDALIRDVKLAIAGRLPKPSRSNPLLNSATIIRALSPCD